jgi:hypothetical protein
MKRTKARKQKAANWRPLLFLGVVVIVINATAFYFAFQRQNAQPTARQIPHYFATAEMAKPLPRTLEPTGFSNRDVVAAYRAAKAIPKVLAQQPCYCHCDRNMGHRSLLDCFAGKHASECDICVKEALFAMQEHRKGRAPEQIRAEIIRGDWKAIKFQN